MNNDSTKLHNALPLSREILAELRKSYPGWGELPDERTSETRFAISLHIWLERVALLIAAEIDDPFGDRLENLDDVPIWLLDEPARNETILSIFNSALYSFVPELEPRAE